MIATNDVEPSIFSDCAVAMVDRLRYVYIGKHSTAGCAVAWHG